MNNKLLTTIREKKISCPTWTILALSPVSLARPSLTLHPGLGQSLKYSLNASLCWVVSIVCCRFGPWGTKRRKKRRKNSVTLRHSFSKFSKGFRFFSKDLFSNDHKEKYSSLGLRKRLLLGCVRKKNCTLQKWVWKTEQGIRWAWTRRSVWN